MLPSILGPIICGEGKMSWELHIIVKSWVYPKDKKVKRLVRPILDWMMWSCVKGRNEDTRAKKRHDRGNHPISRVQILEKIRLEGTIGKWTEAQRVAAPQINAGSEVTAAKSLSVSQSESFLCEVKKLQ